MKIPPNFRMLGIWLIISVHVLCSTYALSQPAIYQSPHVAVARFIHNLVDHIEFPSPTESIILCSYGYDLVADYLKKVTDVRHTHYESVIVKNNQPLSQIKECHIVYIAENTEAPVQRVLERANETHAFTLSQEGGFLQKGGTALVTLFHGRIKLSIDGNSVRNKRIKVSPLLQRFVVHEGS